MYYGSPDGIMSHHLNWHVNQQSQARFFQVMVCPWQPSRCEAWCEHKLMALRWAKNDTFCLGRTAKTEIPSFCKFNTKHV